LSIAFADVRCVSLGQPGKDAAKEKIERSCALLPANERFCERTGLENKITFNLHRRVWPTPLLMNTVNNM
jgi:hypothetical protein